MRKRTVRNGMRLVMAALIIIILASFYHGTFSDMFSLTSAAGNRIYSLSIFWAAAIGGYGVVLVAFGFVLSSQRRDESVRILPTFMIIFGLIFLFFYLLSASINGPVKNDQKRLQPGETITI
jgi:nitrate/nitrite transporter NarK